MRVWLIIGAALTASVAGFGFLSANGVYVFLSDSMRPSFEQGQQVSVDKFAYGITAQGLAFNLGSILGEHRQPLWARAQPQRGAVVVYTYRSTIGRTVTKLGRVVAVAGDRIEMVDGRLILDGVAVPTRSLGGETYTPHHFPRPVTAERLEESLPGAGPYSVYDSRPNSLVDQYGPTTVPSGHVFILGDNRDESVDSRVPGGPGMVPLGHVIGRVRQ